MNRRLQDQIHHTPGRTPDPTVDSTIELYDSDILAIEKVIARLNAEDVGQRRELEDFVQKVKEKFHDIGFLVDVLVWTSNVDGVFVPEITINGRVEDKPFDYDRQVHEVTNDLLELGEGGVISTKKMKPGA